MAVNLSGRKRSYRANLMVSRFLALDCPYLQGMEESVAMRVILTPGEARVRVLSWLIDRFQKDSLVEQQNTSISMDTGTLTNCLASIGVCTKDNIAVVEGHTSLQQQLLFLECLLDMVELALSKESESQLECSCRFSDALCCSESLDTRVFPRSVNLLPTDIGNTTDARFISVEHLDREAERLTTALQERQAELHSVMQQHQYEEVNETLMQSSVKTLAVSVGTLAQLVVNFCQSYEAELQPWVGHRQPPTLGPLGSLCKKTATHWNHIRKILQSLQQLKATLEKLHSIPEPTITYPVCFKAQETLQQCVDMMSDLVPT